VKLTLPNSQRVNVINVYLPPSQSLKRRAITETEATTKIEDIIDHSQPQLTTIICGDFNARTGE
jgi:exonuclease III